MNKFDAMEDSMNNLTESFYDNDSKKFRKEVFNVRNYVKDSLKSDFDVCADELREARDSGNSLKWFNNIYFINMLLSHSI